MTSGEACDECHTTPRTADQLVALANRARIGRQFSDGLTAWLSFGRALALRAVNTEPAIWRENGERPRRAYVAGRCW
jgi:hypothetical protein